MDIASMNGNIRKRSIGGRVFILILSLFVFVIFSFVFLYKSNDNKNRIENTNGCKTTTTVCMRCCNCKDKTVALPTSEQ